MNKQGNTYTFIYSIVLVVVVAAILAIVSLSLKPYQDENIENEKRQNILSSVNVSSTPETSAELFNKIITKQFILNYKGEAIEGNAFAILLMNTFAPLIDWFVVQGNIKRRLKRAKQFQI